MRIGIFLAGLLAAGCADNDPPDWSKVDWSKVQKIEVTYSVGGQRNRMLQIDPAKVLPAFKVTDSAKGAFVSNVPQNEVQFYFPDSRTVIAQLVREDLLEIRGWGELFLDKRFYEALTEAVSKHEGRPIDLLKAN